MYLACLRNCFAPRPDRPCVQEGVVSMNDSMSAAVIACPHELQMVSAPLPVPPAGHVRIRLEGTGVCASNLSLWDGAPWFSYPMEPGLGGHESWGVVEQL